MNLHQLKIFYETAQNENLSKTAEKYLIPTSSVSASIKRLEEELNVKLFERTANKIKLTEKGKIFANEIHFAFARIENGVNLLTLEEDSTTEIRLGVFSRPKWIAEIIGKFCKIHSNVNIVYDYLPKQYEIDDYDFIISESNDAFKSLKRYLLSTELLCIKASKDSTLTNKELKISDLANENFILHNKSSHTREVFNQMCESNSISPNVLIQCNDSLVLQYYVESGFGLTIGAYNAQNDIIKSNMVPLNVIDFNETQNVFVYYREKALNNSILKQFSDFLYTHRYIE